ncbi:TPA: hypothetical protein N0F65_005271 [Lagenidium giganteum]|uniref:Cilia- and flagella-associated protein 157 n=1 Tax=Lagenidium giganteum TaxID=4803 RepID=A0AAV2Z0W8_9STRA|nr:TPA: hypothetical protein N0F65_005271 [Lagenidium giganteum]
MQPGTPEDNAPKFRSKILGLSAVSEQNAAMSLDREETTELHDAKDAIIQLEQELTRRQESYVRRERQYKVRISELESQLTESRAKKTKESSVDASLDGLRQMHRSIMESVEQVQERTSKILQEQEKDLLRAFRARLYSVQEELESEKNKTDDGASAWIEKSKQLETEVEWTKELADRLDRLNQSLTRENQRLKTQFTTQENDREFLVKQLVAVKKDNVRLRNEYDALKRQADALKDEVDHSQRQPAQVPPGTPGTALSASTSALPKMFFGNSSLPHTPGPGQQRPNTATGAGMGASDADNRYKEIIKRLKRLLETERKNLQQVRGAYKMELQNRTELEIILKECIQDVRAEITNHTALPSVSSPTTSAGGLRRPETASTMTLLEGVRLSAVERQRLIEKLLAKERLLSLLTSRAFPIRNGKPVGDPLLTGDALTPEEMAKIYSEVTSSS